MMPRQHTFQLPFRPILCLPVLTDRAVTVAAGTDFHRVLRPPAFILPVKKVIPEFLSGNPIRLFSEILNGHPDGPGL
jgi:hypothetical protein